MTAFATLAAGFDHEDENTRMDASDAIRRRTLQIAATLLVALAVTGLPAHAQVFRCVQPDGRTTYQGMPCPEAAEQRDVRVNVAPPAEPARAVNPARASEPVRRDVERERSRAQRDAEEARAEVRRIRSENYDPERCAVVRARIAQARQRDPIGFMYSPDVMEFRQMESLYCGN